MIQKKTIALLLTGLALPLIAAQPTPTPQPDALSHQVPGHFYAALLAAHIWGLIFAT